MPFMFGVQRKFLWLAEWKSSDRRLAGCLHDHCVLRAKAEVEISITSGNYDVRRATRGCLDRHLLIRLSASPQPAKAKTSRQKPVKYTPIKSPETCRSDATLSLLGFVFIPTFQRFVSFQDIRLCRNVTTIKPLTFFKNLLQNTECCRIQRR